MTRERWISFLKLAGAFILLGGISFVIAFLFQRLLDAMNLPLDRYAFLAYLIVFAVTLVANATVIAPIPIAVTIMITVAQNWNPLLTALAAALGGSIGELTGYFAGYAGRKVAASNSIVSMKKIEGWVNRWGPWAIAFLAFQPILPFDVGGIAAGAARMPLVKFFPALFAGKLPKYIILVYMGIGVLYFLPQSWLSS